MNVSNAGIKGRISLLAIVLPLLLFCCASSSIQYSLSQVYTMDAFSGGDINNNTVSVAPVLTEAGPVSEQKMPYAIIGDTLRIHRPELKFSQLQGMQSSFLKQVSPVDVQNFYQILYQGRILQLQTIDTVWQAIGSGYLLVFNVRYGMSVYTFNRGTRKKVRMEAELWDCSEREVVWRVSADGTCFNKDVSDIQFLTHGVGRIVEALPVITPSYDRSKW